MGVSMSSNLLALLRTEERQLLVELRATPTFQKLEAVRRVIGLYSGGGPDAEPPTEELLLGRVEAPGPAHDPAAARDSGPPLRGGAATAGDARAAAPPPSVAGAGPGEARLAPSDGRDVPCAAGQCLGRRAGAVARRGCGAFRRPGVPRRKQGGLRRSRGTARRHPLTRGGPDVSLRPGGGRRRRPGRCRLAPPVLSGGAFAADRRRSAPRGLAG
jgi:hypothetical protein